MGSGEAFESFLADDLANVIQIKNFYIRFRDKKIRLEHFFYKWLRCELAHTAELPHDVIFEAQQLGGITLSIDAEECIRLSHGWLDGLVDVVVNAPENSDQFGDPPKAPMPLHLAGFNITVGCSSLTQRPAPSDNP